MRIAEAGKIVSAIMFFVKWIKLNGCLLFVAGVCHCGGVDKCLTIIENNKIVLKNRKLLITIIHVWVIMITELFCSVSSLNHDMTCLYEDN